MGNLGDVVELPGRRTDHPRLMPKVLALASGVVTEVTVGGRYRSRSLNQTRLGSGLPGRLWAGVSVTPTLECCGGWPVAASEAHVGCVEVDGVSRAGGRSRRAPCTASPTSRRRPWCRVGHVGDGFGHDRLEGGDARCAAHHPVACTSPPHLLCPGRRQRHRVRPPVRGRRAATGLTWTPTTGSLAGSSMQAKATTCPSTITVSHYNITNTYTFATMRRSLTTVTQTTTGPGLVLYTETRDDTTGVYTRTGRGRRAPPPWPRRRRSPPAPSERLEPPARRRSSPRSPGSRTTPTPTGNARPPPPGNTVSYVETLRQDMPGMDICCGRSLLASAAHGRWGVRRRRRVGAGRSSRLPPWAKALRSATRKRWTPSGTFQLAGGGWTGTRPPPWTTPMIRRCLLCAVVVVAAASLVPPANGPDDVVVMAHRSIPHPGKHKVREPADIPYHVGSSTQREVGEVPPDTSRAARQ